jgi:predicted dehydrogenase
MSKTAAIIGTGGAAGMGLFGVHDDSAIGNERVLGSHAGGYDACEDLELVAIADIDEANLDSFGEVWDVPASNRYLDHETMLAQESLDVVSVCTPSSLHHDHVVDAAESDANPAVIWCEKPIAASVSGADDMIDTCQSTGTELLVNHSFRFTEKIQHLRQLLLDGQLLGDVYSISLQFRMELLRNATHILDLLTYLLDAKPVTVSGYVNGKNEAADTLAAGTDVDDAGGGGHLVLEDGTFVTLDCTVPREASSMSLRFTGSNGMLLLNNDEGEWRYWALEDGAHEERPIPGIDAPWTWETDYEPSFPNAAAHVSDLVDGRTENRSPGTDARRSLEVINSIFISHYTGGRVSLPLDAPLRDVEIRSW